MSAAQAQNVKEIFNTKRSNEEIANKLIVDLKNSGVKLGDQMNLTLLTAVYLLPLKFSIKILINNSIKRKK